MEAFLLVFSQSVTRARIDLFSAAKEIKTSHSQNHCFWGSYRLTTLQQKRPVPRTTKIVQWKWVIFHPSWSEIMDIKGQVQSYSTQSLEHPPDMFLLWTLSLFGSLSSTPLSPEPLNQVWKRLWWWKKLMKRIFKWRAYFTSVFAFKGRAYSMQKLLWYTVGHDQRFPCVVQKL